MNPRMLFHALVGLLIVLAATACQPIAPAAQTDTGAESAAGNVIPTVTFTGADYAYEGPASIPGGLTRIEFVNAGEHEHTLWLIKLDEGKTFDDVMGVFAALETDPQMPAWIGWYGGVGAGPGQTNAYTIDLPPGNYTIFSFGEDAEGVPDAAKGMMATLDVAEAVDADVLPPEADLRMELVDFSFVVEGQPTVGPQIVEITNVGMEPHEAMMLRLNEGASMEDAMDFLMAGEEAGGPPPFEFMSGAAPINAGMTAWYEMDLHAGDYGLICFIPSPPSKGAPHFMLGMTAQLTVEGS